MAVATFHPWSFRISNHAFPSSGKLGAARKLAWILPIHLAKFLSRNTWPMKDLWPSRAAKRVSLGLCSVNQSKCPPFRLQKKHFFKLFEFMLCYNTFFSYSSFVARFATLTTMYWWGTYGPFSMFTIVLFEEVLRSKRLMHSPQYSQAKSAKKSIKCLTISCVAS